MPITRGGPIVAPATVLLAQFRDLGVRVVAADSGTDLTAADEDPARVLIRQMLGAVSQFEKSVIVAKLRAARVRQRRQTGRIASATDNAASSANSSGGWRESQDRDLVVVPPPVRAASHGVPGRCGRAAAVELAEAVRGQHLRVHRTGCRGGQVAILPDQRDLQPARAQINRQDIHEGRLFSCALPHVKGAFKRTACGRRERQIGCGLHMRRGGPRGKRRKARRREWLATGEIADQPIR
jgi:hypothetical protein